MRSAAHATRRLRARLGAPGPSHRPARLENARSATRSCAETKALQESALALHALMQAIPLGVALLDRDRRYLAASRRWLRDHHLGLANAECEPPGGGELPLRLPEAWHAAHRRALAGKPAGRDEHLIVRADGIAQWVKWTAVPWRIAGDAIGGVLITAEDVTAAVLARASRPESATARPRGHVAVAKAPLELLPARMFGADELATSIAHEINQPLAALVNNASACVRWLAAHNIEEARQSAEDVVAQGHRASAIVTRVRALAEKAPPTVDWFDLNEAIRETLATIRPGADAHAIVLQARLGYLPLVRADRLQFQQVLLNLVNNAVEAMCGAGPGPGAAWMSGRRELIVSSEMQGSDALVAVRDSGPGLDSVSSERLFDAFYSTKPRGLGMGLGICRAIVESHQGRLWASANTPHGAVFQFTLPIDGPRRA